MRYFKVFFLALSLVILPAQVFAVAGYTGSGFGTIAVNQDFCDDGTTYNGQPVYVNTSNNEWLFNEPAYGNLWIVWNGYPPVSGNSDYYNASGAITSGSWTVQNGMSPGGSFVSTTCASPTPTPTTFDGYGLVGAIATSTLNIVTNVGVTYSEVLMGLLMAFFLIFLLITAFSIPLKNLLLGKNRRKR